MTSLTIFTIFDNFDNFNIFLQFWLFFTIDDNFHNSDNCFCHFDNWRNKILETCDIWDTDYNSDNWEPEFMTIWQLIVTLDSIRNSCDVLLNFGEVWVSFWPQYVQRSAMNTFRRRWSLPFFVEQINPFWKQEVSPTNPGKYLFQCCVCRLNEKWLSLAIFISTLNSIIFGFKHF